VELAVGAGQVLELFVQLLLDLGELLRVEGVKVDCEGDAVSFIETPQANRGAILTYLFLVGRS
jgi:hypothetical protein